VQLLGAVLQSCSEAMTTEEEVAPGAAPAAVEDTPATAPEHTDEPAADVNPTGAPVDDSGAAQVGHHSSL
jgi:hypothetical protein